MRRIEFVRCMVLLVGVYHKWHVTRESFLQFGNLGIFICTPECADFAVLREGRLQEISFIRCLTTSAERAVASGSAERLWLAHLSTSYILGVDV